MIVINILFYTIAKKMPAFDLIRPREYLSKAEKLYKVYDLKNMYDNLVQCFNVLPHSTNFTPVDHSPKLILSRYELEARANELMGHVYWENASASGSNHFEMKNATTKEEMKCNAIMCWNITLKICSQSEYKDVIKKFQICRLRIMPTYLFAMQQSNKKMTTSQIILKVFEMIDLVKKLYSDSSIERASSISDIIDLVAIYCPTNDKLLETLSTSIMYYCSRNSKNQCIYDNISRYNSYKMCIHSRTRLLQLWEKQNWKGAVKCCAC